MDLASVTSGFLILLRATLSSSSLKFHKNYIIVTLSLLELFHAVLFEYCKHDADLLSGAPSHESTKIMKWLSRLLVSKEVRA
ncbi:hypothetical protein RDI58_027520 [Solanum bulbocastanum]|uniref:Uncharacterized protein n=1 Tax=Solanum bulbocastanum TaxID=147425 RepID=A0AAN8SW36_SOLBU